MRTVEYIIYGVCVIFFVIPIYVFFTTSDWPQRLLALSVAVAILGVAFNMLTFERPYKAAKDQIKGCLEDFVSVGSATDVISLGNQERERLQREITDVGTSFKTVIENIEKLIILPSDISKEAKTISKTLIKLTPKIARSMTSIVVEWDELREQAKKLIVKLGKGGGR